MSSDEVVIDVHNLSKRYEIYAKPRDRLKQFVLPRIHRWFGSSVTPAKPGGMHDVPHYFREFWALRDISFQVRQGETLGIIGRNGSGKSTLLQLLAGTLASTSGDVRVAGRVAALLELGSGFDPELIGRDNVFLNGRILGLSHKEIEARYDRIVEFADIGAFIDEPVKTYSSGMFLRLAFAVQAHIDASIVIIDEALAVGDIFFRQKCYTRLEQLKASGAAILLVSHSMPDIEQHCDRALLLDHGVGTFLGESSEAAKHYYLLHQAEQVKQLKSAAAIGAATVVDDTMHTFARPTGAAFFDLRAKSQVAIEGVRCTGAAITDEAGEPCFTFQQGDVAQLYVEYEIVGHSGVPLSGVVIKNDRGIIVHGKNAWQSETDLPTCDGTPVRVSALHSVALNLAQGEYVFEAGLAFVTQAQWRNRNRISHEEMSALYVTACVVANIGVFSIGLKMRDGIAVLTHHGIADLPGRIETQVDLIGP